MKLRPQKQTNGMTLVTTPSHHSDQVVHRLVFKYLNALHPIIRVKINGKFKRSVEIEGRIYSVSNEKTSFIPIIIKNLASSFAINETVE